MSSPVKPELATALLAAQKAMPTIALDAINPHFKNKYVSLPKLLDAVRPVLNEAGLVLTQTPTHTPDGTHALRTRITHAGTGEYLEDTMLLLLNKQDAQGQGSAITYARRYAILSVLGLAGEDDDDGAAASNPAAPRASVPRGAQPGPPKTREEKPYHPDDDAHLYIEKAQAAQAAAGEVPTDAGDPRSELVHFGKNAGKSLGELSRKSLEWYATQWEAKPPYDFNAQDRRLKLAAQMILGLAPEEIPAPGPDDDDIPF